MKLETGTLHLLTCAAPVLGDLRSLPGENVQIIDQEKML